MAAARPQRDVTEWNRRVPRKQCHAARSHMHVTRSRTHVTGSHTHAARKRRHVSASPKNDARCPRHAARPRTRRVVVHRVDATRSSQAGSELFAATSPKASCATLPRGVPSPRRALVRSRSQVSSCSRSMLSPLARGTRFRYRNPAVQSPSRLTRADACGVRVDPLLALVERARIAEWIDEAV
jgi:hypothetical protein